MVCQRLTRIIDLIISDMRGLLDDLEAMLERSRAAGVKSMIITGGSLHESREALELAKQFNFYATVGCHPTRSRQFDQFKGGPNAYLEELDKLIEANLDGNGQVVAVGECGLGELHSFCIFAMKVEASQSIQTMTVHISLLLKCRRKISVRFVRLP